MSKNHSYIRATSLLEWVCIAASLILILNLAGGSEYSFGTKVLPTDVDVGRPLYSISDEISVGYWDTGTPGYDENDTVYLHIAPQDYPDTRAGDVRLTSFENHSAGSKIAPQDDDMNKPLTMLNATINYVNLHGSQEYDIEDPVYIHQINYNYFSETAHQERSGCDSSYLYRNLDQDKKLLLASSLDGFKERLPYSGRGIFITGVNCITFTDNYKLLVSDRFFNCVPDAIGNYRGSSVEVIHGLKADYYHILGTWLVKISLNEMNTYCLSDIGGCNCNFETLSAIQFICTNDIRLNYANGLAAGTKVVDFDSDQNKLVVLPALVSFFGRAKDTSRIRYFDANGNGMYDYPDDVYLNFPERDTTSSVTVNSVRLSGPVS